MRLEPVRGAVLEDSLNGFQAGLSIAIERLNYGSIMRQAFIAEGIVQDFSPGTVETNLS